MFSPKDVALTRKRIREKVPLIHNITNVVVTQITANMLLALGASPAMVNAREEVEEFVIKANALVINLGTITHFQAESMKLAAKMADNHHIPWVMDPVGIGAISYRSHVALDLLAYHPSVIRGNPSEIIGLNAMVHRHPLMGGRGVDSLARSDEALLAAQSLAQYSQSIVSISGKTDYVTDGKQVVAIHNGDAMMPYVTGLGCSATAITAACLAVQQSKIAAAVHAMVLLGVAGERAAKQVKGPGSLCVAILDELYQMDEATLLHASKIEPIQ